MALTLHVRSVNGLKGRGQRQVKAIFRGVAHSTKTLENTYETLAFDETFQWPVGSPIGPEEILDVQVYTLIKYRSNRLLGTFTMILQELIQVGSLTVTDCLMDVHKACTPVTVTLQLTYCAPDGSVGPWLADEPGTTSMAAMLGELQTPDGLTHGLQYLDPGGSIELEGFRNEKAALGASISNLSVVSSTSSRTSKKSSKSRSLASVVSSALFLKSKHSNKSEYGEKVNLGYINELDNESSDLDAKVKEIAAEIARSLKVEDEESASGDSRSGPVLLADDADVKPEDFQVCLTVIEARQLAGLNMDPVVCVQVGDHKKFTSVKESTNCPYYNEYFVFDFHMTPAILFDQIVSLTVLHSRNIVRSGTVVGSFKMELGAVYRAKGHQFYQKWAILTDPDDFTGGIKGYLKCNIAVLGKGDSVQVPPKSARDDVDDIESNLLLPDNIPPERQKARYVVRVFRADGLPKMDTGLMANVKKALTGESKDLVDPYVQVHFYGHKGRTTVQKGSYQPVWNEQLVFTELFPTLARRMRVQLCDSNSLQNEVIATHFLDLSAMSNDGHRGFLPTFGPAWINLYGSTRHYQVVDKNGHLNDGVGPGVSYRGRLLLALHAALVTDPEDVSLAVEVEPTFPISELAAGKIEEHFLFGTFLEASMIERKIGDKPIYFEMSIGNAGNTLDGGNVSTTPGSVSTTPGSVDTHLESAARPLLPQDKDSTVYPRCLSTTPAVKPVSRDKRYYHLPYGDKKPCVFVSQLFEDHRRRMYNPNIVERMADKLEVDLYEVQSLMEEDATETSHYRLRSVLEELARACSRFTSLVKGTGGGSAAGKTRLDKERHRLLVREMEHMANNSRNVLTSMTQATMAAHIQMCFQWLERLRSLTNEPQHALPDVFIWLVSNNKRIAYHRIQARHLIYSLVEEERGRYCGRPVTILLKLPGKKATGSSGWPIQAKIVVYLWLGITKLKKDVLKGLPIGYEKTPALGQLCTPSGEPPPCITYAERLTFQLRSYLYQARNLIGSDDSGLSDPFACVTCCDRCQLTQVIEETLSPTWDETLILEDIDIFGQINDITTNPPLVIVEIFDQDKSGKQEFIGRAICQPLVRAREEPYLAPKFPARLQWWDILRGREKAGELLASFELLQKPFDESDLALAYQTPPAARKQNVLLQLEATKDTQRQPDNRLGVQSKDKILRVPKGIRPILCKHRIEVLFWGVRDLKRVQLQSVDRPRIDIEFGGNILSSSVITNCKKNPNFGVPVRYMELDLPDNDLYCPPITVRCVDCRSFGRFTLVGTHVISHIRRFMVQIKPELLYNSRPKWTSNEESALGAGGDGLVSFKDDTVLVKAGKPPMASEKEKSPTIVDTEVAAAAPMDNTPQPPKKSQQKGTAKTDPDTDSETLDWWSKYFASLDTAAKAARESDVEGDVSRPEDSIAPDVVIKPASKIKTLKDKKKKQKTSDQLQGVFKKLVPRSAEDVVKKPYVEELVIYPNELENQPEFNGFKDLFETFDLLRGKNTGKDELLENRVVGKFKGSLKIYKFPAPDPNAEPVTSSLGGENQVSFFQNVPSNEPTKVLVRAYVVKATELHPADINGKADPYLVVKLGSKVFNEKENYVSKQLNPVFGKCFEFEARFPTESVLTVQIFDWDLIGSDDLIGQTKIDLENRLYSRHRATCGLARKYELHGYNSWRDCLKPTQILTKLCKELKLDGPHFLSGRVKVADQVFTAPVTIQDENGVVKVTDEHLALAALRNWSQIPEVGCQLVPEHVEARALYHPDKPGIEQGKVHLFVDLFAADLPAPGPPVNVTPRKPKSYELRCIIWNTDDVVLEDDAFFTGEKMSDIYVKGWVTGQEDTQSTDVHYRSLTGEGNFNWRFVFPFDYLAAEEKIVITKKESLFSWDLTEYKQPARLHLQVWDADHFSADDFLGSLTLDLNQFPRGAKSAKKCNLDMLRTDGSVPRMSLFRQTRVKGWWPFYVQNKDTDQLELTGKVEAELQLVTSDEAEKQPVGLGRSEPEPLDKPNRPDSSFMWFMSPFKSLRYVLWRNYKWVFLRILLIAFLVFMVILFFYSMPGYTVKKMFNV